MKAGGYRNAFCCVRPPGHHCGNKGHTETAASQGYCILNNIAVAALYAKYKHNFERIAVVGNYFITATYHYLLLQLIIILLLHNYHYFITAHNYHYLMLTCE